jgi:O-antigen/teichoic acid export membrane protein
VIIKKVITNRAAIAKWTGKGFWAVMDQGLFATTNFILNILLARWLNIIEYGTFSVAYTIFLLLATFYSATLSDPMLVFGPGKYKSKIGAYMRVLLLGQWIFGVTIGIIFFFAYLALWRFTSSPQAPVFFGLAIASPFILFQWMMRRACYINLNPQFAAIAGAGYMALNLFGAFSLYYFKCLSPNTALFTLAIASLLSGLWLFFKLRVCYNFRKDSGLIRDVLNDHWQYGKWASGTAALSWIPGNIFTLFLPIWWGIEASAAYKALINMLLPMMHVTTALGAIFLPILVSRRGLPSFRHLVLLFLVFIILVTVIYWVLLGVFSEVIIRFLYNGKYLEYVDLLWLTGIIPIMGGLVTISGCALQAIELPDKVFISYVASSGVTLTIGLLFVLSMGVSGAMVGTLTAYIITGSIMTGILASIKKPSGFKIDITEKK